MAFTPPRRGVLTLVATAAGIALAGCAETEPTDGGGTGRDGSTATSGSSPSGGSSGTVTSSAAAGDTTDSTTRPSSDSGPLDLREANVTAVAVDCTARECRFDVTLYHDDAGEPGYANWWQVETREGDRLGRRDLRHAHGTRKFTRSATFAIPDGVVEVVVRGHDQTHGYGGQAMVVDLSTGETTPVRQGADPRSVDG